MEVRGVEIRVPVVEAVLALVRVVQADKADKVNKVAEAVVAVVDEIPVVVTQGLSNNLPNLTRTKTASWCKPRCFLICKTPSKWRTLIATEN